MDIRTLGLLILGFAISVSVDAQTNAPEATYYNNNMAVDKNNYQQPQVVTVGQRKTGVSTILGATVVPYREVAFSAETSGRVEYIAGQEGDRFNQEQVLLALDTDELLARREQVLADLNMVESGCLHNHVRLIKCPGWGCHLYLTNFLPKILPVEWVMAIRG